MYIIIMSENKTSKTNNKQIKVTIIKATFITKVTIAKPTSYDENYYGDYCDNE